MNLNIINKKITSLLFAALMITSVFAAFMMPVAAVGGVDLSIQPPTRSIGVGETFTLDIQAVAGAQQVAGISAFLDFNPRYLEVVSIAPGATLPTVLQNRFNNTIGTVDYSAGDMIAPFPTGTFTVATITFRTIRTTPAIGTAITFNRTSPRQTMADFGGADVTGSTIGTTVTTVAAVAPPPVVAAGTAFNEFPAIADARRSALLGQDIRITGLTAGSIVAFTGMGGAAEDHHFTVTANAAGVADFDMIARGMRTGRYRVNATIGAAPGTPISFDLFVDSPILTLRVELAGTAEAVTNVAQGTSVEVDISTNILGADRGDIRLTDPNGLALRANPADGMSLRNLSFADIDTFRINTTGWDVGTWRIEVRTDADRAQGLDMRSNVVDLRILEDEVSIRVRDDTINVNESTTFTVTAPAGRWVNITVDTDNVVLIPQAGDVTTRTTVPGRLIFRTNRSFDVRIRDGGTFVFALEFTDDGTHTVTARLDDREVDIDIIVAKQEITINPLPAITVGERVDITGTAIGLRGRDIYVRIEDPDNDPIITPTPRIDWTARPVRVRADDTWRVEWSTEGLEEHTYRIEVFRTRDDALRNRNLEDVIVVGLIHGALRVVVPSTVSETDSTDLEVTGTAIGADRVRIIVVENRDSFVVLHESTSVDRRDWSFNEDMVRELDSGMHTVLVIHPGGDRIFTPPPLAAVGSRDRYSIARIIERFRDVLGRDDTLIVREFLVEDDRVTILPITDVAIGETLNIRAETNRDDDTMAIVTLIGPDQIVRLETTRVVEGGELSVEFDTRNFTLGNWRVEVEVTGTDPEAATFRVVAARPVDPPVVLTGIRVSDASVVVGRTHTFRASPDPAGARIGNVTWTVADTAIGTITPAGVFTARAEGTTTITATYRGITGTATATVTAPPVATPLTGISVSAAPAQIVVGGTHTFRASPIPAGATLGTVTWTVADPAIGTITPAGVFTARAAGTTTITATYGGVTGTTTVTVTAPPVPGFGIVAAIVGLLGVALLMLKKNKK